MAYVAVGYLVSQLYMNVFGLAVDTILQCFIISEDRMQPANIEIEAGLHTKLDVVYFQDPNPAQT